MAISETNPATMNVMFYCTWHPSDLTTGLHGQVLDGGKWRVDTWIHGQCDTRPNFTC